MNMEFHQKLDKDPLILKQHQILILSLCHIHFDYRVKENKS